MNSFTAPFSGNLDTINHNLEVINNNLIELDRINFSNTPTKNFVIATIDSSGKINKLEIKESRTGQWWAYIQAKLSFKKNLVVVKGKKNLLLHLNEEFNHIQKQLTQFQANKLDDTRIVGVRTTSAYLNAINKKMNSLVPKIRTAYTGDPETHQGLATSPLMRAAQKESVAYQVGQEITSNAQKYQNLKDKLARLSEREIHLSLNTPNTPTSLNTEASLATIQGEIDYFAAISTDIEQAKTYTTPAEIENFQNTLATHQAAFKTTVGSQFKELINQLIIPRVVLSVNRRESLIQIEAEITRVQGLARQLEQFRTHLSPEDMDIMTHAFKNKVGTHFEEIMKALPFPRLPLAEKAPDFFTQVHERGEYLKEISRSLEEMRNTILPGKMTEIQGNLAAQHSTFKEGVVSQFQNISTNLKTTILGDPPLAQFTDLLKIYQEIRAGASSVEQVDPSLSLPLEEEIQTLATTLKEGLTKHKTKLEVSLAEKRTEIAKQRATQTYTQSTADHLEATLQTTITGSLARLPDLSKESRDQNTYKLLTLFLDYELLVKKGVKLEEQQHIKHIKDQLNALGKKQNLGSFSTHPQQFEKALRLKIKESLDRNQQIYRSFERQIESYQAKIKPDETVLQQKLSLIKHLNKAWKQAIAALIIENPEQGKGLPTNPKDIIDALPPHLLEQLFNNLDQNLETSQKAILTGLYSKSVDSSRHPDAVLKIELNPFYDALCDFAEYTTTSLPEQAKKNSKQFSVDTERAKQYVKPSTILKEELTGHLIITKIEKFTKHPGSILGRQDLTSSMGDVRAYLRHLNTVKGGSKDSDKIFAELLLEKLGVLLERQEFEAAPAQLKEIEKTIQGLEKGDEAIRDRITIQNLQVQGREAASKVSEIENECTPLIQAITQIETQQSRLPLTA